jgi:hypothetical protein
LALFLSIGLFLNKNLNPVTYNLRISINSFLLLGALFFTLHLFIQNTPSITFPELGKAESLTQFSLEELEVFLQKKLDGLRAGQSISYEDEIILKKIKALLSIYSAENSALISKLIAMIDEILELSNELIHVKDGEHRTDND